MFLYRWPSRFGLETSSEDFRIWRGYLVVETMPDRFCSIAQYLPLPCIEGLASVYALVRRHRQINKAIPKSFAAAKPLFYDGG
jgi:hypothetical protein